MPRFLLERQVRIRRPVEALFPFFADPRNLEAITPPWLRFRIVSSTDAPVRAGAEIEYRLRLHGLPIRWRSRITLWEPPRRFVDEQIAGPFRYWRHLHELEPDGDGTIVRDRVEYEVPGGRAVNRLFVRRELERIFDHRHRRLLELLPPVRR